MDVVDVITTPDKETHQDAVVIATRLGLFCPGRTNIHHIHQRTQPPYLVTV